MSSAITSRLKTGIEAPNFVLKDLNDKDIDLASFRGKSSILIFFWVADCYACQIETSEITKLYPKFKEKNIEILAINLGDSKERAQSFVKRYNVNYPVLLDLDTNVGRAYKLIGVPTLVLVDQKGIVSFVENELPREFKD